MNNKTIKLERRDNRVKIIRCKECIHHASFFPWCKEHETRMTDNDYCSKGEHK